MHCHSLFKDSSIFFDRLVDSESIFLLEIVIVMKWHHDFIRSSSFFLECKQFFHSNSAFVHVPPVVGKLLEKITRLRIHMCTMYILYYNLCTKLLHMITEKNAQVHKNRYSGSWVAITKIKCFFSLVSTNVSYAKCVFITDHSFYMSVACWCFYLYLPATKMTTLKITHISICKEDTHPAFRQVCTYIRCIIHT